MPNNRTLDVVCAISNPLHYSSRISLYKKFEEHMLSFPNVRLTTIECAYGEHDFEIPLNVRVNNVRVRAKTVLWSKERLQNLALARLPEDALKVCFLDGDVHFRSATWAQDTLDALDTHDVCQPWQFCIDLDEHGQFMQLHESFMSVLFSGKPIRSTGYYGSGRFPHPGFGLAWRLDALSAVGNQIDTGVLGSGDHHQLLALIGRASESMPAGISEGYARPILQWQDRAMRVVNQRLTFTPGTIEHGYHGAKKNRAYISRWDIVTKNAFDPAVDLVTNMHGVYELAGNKPQLQLDISRYMESRLEDDRSMRLGRVSGNA